MSVRGLGNFVCFVAGVILLVTGFTNDIVWMILLGGVLLLIATGWFIYIRRHPTDESSSGSSSGDGFFDLLS